jgi:CheY-like chemotaxis protein
MARTTIDSMSRLRALALDGDAGSLRALSRALESRCFSVLAASDGTRGLELLLEELLSLDVVVIDAALPHRDALAFAELIRREGGEHDLAIVVVAHGATAELRGALLATGVDAIVEASAGPETAAAAAVGAVVARGARILDEDEAEPAETAPPKPEPTAFARFELPFTAGWLLQPA